MECRGKCGKNVSGTGFKYCVECPTVHQQRGRKSPITEKFCRICESELPYGSRKSAICDNPSCRKELDWERNLFRVYHIRPDQFYRLFEEQGWSCGVCKEPLFSLINASKEGC